MLLVAMPVFADDLKEGMAHYKSGAYAFAKAFLEQAVVDNPNSWEAHFHLANTFMHLKDPANAKKEFQKVLSLEPPEEIKTKCDESFEIMKSDPKLEKFTKPKPKAATYRPSLYQSQYNSYGSYNSTSSSSASPSSSAGSSDAQLQANQNRERILRDAEEQVKRMQAEENERLQGLISQSNSLFKDADGNVKRGLTEEEMAEFQRTVDQKAAAIRERAKREAAAIR